MAAALVDAFGFVASHREGTSAIPGADNRNNDGAQCWIIWWNNGHGFERNLMRCRSRGSHWINIWQPANRLQNWRVKFVPPGLREHVMHFPVRVQAEEHLKLIMPTLRQWLLSTDGSRAC